MSTRTAGKQLLFCKHFLENIKNIICINNNGLQNQTQVRIHQISTVPVVGSTNLLPQPLPAALESAKWRNRTDEALQAEPELGLRSAKTFPNDRSTHQSSRFLRPIRVDLQSGQLSPRNVELSGDIIREANKNMKIHHLARKNAEMFYLSALAGFLTKEYKEPVLKQDLVATNGASVSLLSLLSLLFPNKCPVFVEELSYFQALEALKDTLNFPVIGIPFDHEGIDITSLENTLKAEKSKILRLQPAEPHGLTGILYLVPAFHNPTGVIIPPEKLQGIVRLARKYRVLVVCDDVYNLLYFNTSHPPRRLFSYDDRTDPDYMGSVISNGSFSKFLSSGIKMGWMELPQWLKNIYTSHQAKLQDTVVSDISCELLGNTLNFGAVSTFVAKLRQNYIENKAIVSWILETELLEGCRFTVPQGGTFFWIELPQHMSSTKVQEEALSRYGIRFLHGQRCAADNSGNYANCLRISISYNDRDTLIRNEPHIT